MQLKNQALIIAFVEKYQTSPRLQELAVASVVAGAFLICADSGGTVARQWGLTPDVLLGDMDSITTEDLQFWQEKGIPIQHYPSAKDETDLELALTLALERGYQDLTILGGLGGRLDQTFGNLALLALPTLLKPSITVRIVGEAEEIYLLQGPCHFNLNGTIGESVSLLPATASAQGIRTTNMRYPLHDETLFFGTTRGMSNVITGNPAQVSLESGLLYLIRNLSST